MISLIKQLIRRTWIYVSLGKIKRSARRIQAKRKFLKWTGQDEKMLQFYSEFVKPGSLCFDVGANSGNRAKIFLKLNARVIAVEPQVSCVKDLKEFFKDNSQLYIVPKALGASDGEMTLWLCSSNVLSTLSLEWMESCKESGRFSKYEWENKVTVPVTTIDKLITQYGHPEFIKIDVEGFEYQVLQGLSKPIKTLSIEFTPECVQETIKCLEYLQALSKISTNYSLGEDMKFMLPEWISVEEMTDILWGFKDDALTFGDIYIRSYYTESA